MVDTTKQRPRNVPKMHKFCVVNASFVDVVLSSSPCCCRFCSRCADFLQGTTASLVQRAEHASLVCNVKGRTVWSAHGKNRRGIQVAAGKVAWI